jgi:hypothetical protein
MADGVRKSLSPEEHAIRVRFDALGRGDERRAGLWSMLQDARRRAAREKQRLAVRVRLQDHPNRTASSLIADIVLIKSGTRRSGAFHANRTDGYVKCDLLFDTDLPPCERPGACPHEIVVYVMKADHAGSAAEEGAWDALRELAEEGGGAR